MQILPITAISVVLLIFPTVKGADLIDEQYNEISQFNSLDRRPVLQGVSGSDCGINECSVMGMQRFSEPYCSARRGEGEECIVGAEAENKMLDFPNRVLNCSDVYTLMCPCAQGLVCRAARCVRASRLNLPKVNLQRRFPSRSYMELSSV